MKKDIKKICVVMTLVLVVITLLGITTFAGEVQPSSTTSQNTIVSRVWEWVVSNKTEIIDKTIDGLSLLLVLIFNITYRKLKGKVLNVETTAGKVETAQKNTIAAVNKLGESVEQYTDVTHSDVEGAVAVFKEEIAKLNSKIEEEIARVNTIGIVAAETTAILEILMSVYPNSKNLPQGIKDIVSLKYANCLKVINSDKKISSVMEALHNVVNTVDNSEVNDDEQN